MHFLSFEQIVVIAINRFQIMHNMHFEGPQNYPEIIKTFEIINWVKRFDDLEMFLKGKEEKEIKNNR